MINKLTKTLLVFTAGFLLGCQTTEPVVDYSSENVISFRYHGYNIGPTLPVEVRDLAAKHCAKYGKNAIYKGGKPANMLTTEEIHDFTCERGKVEVID